MMTDDLVSRWERLLASDTTTRTFSVRTVALREALDHIKALHADNAQLRKSSECAMSEIRDYMQEVGVTLPLELALGWLSAALNTGKEVMPSVPVDPPNQPDIGPGEQGVVAGAAPVTLTYTNWRGETAERTIIPARVWFGSTDWHPEPQWLLEAVDVEKGAMRDFALKDFGRPESVAGAAPMQAQIEAARIAALQEAERAVLKLIAGSKKSTIFDADAAILDLIRKGDQP